MKKILFLIVLCIPVITFSQSITDSLINVLPSLEGKEKLKTLKTLTHKYLMQSYNKCIEYGDLAVELAIEMEDLETEAYVRRRVGYANFQIGNYAESIKQYERGFKIYQQLQNTFKTALLADLLSNSYKQVGVYDKSLEYFILGENIGNVLKKDTSINERDVKRYFSILYINGGLLYIRIDSNYKALELFNKALNFAEEIQDSTRITAAFSNMGMVYRDSEKYDDAMRYYKRALNIARKTGNRYETAILMNIANVFDEIQENDSAMIYFNKSLEIAEYIDDKYSIAKNHHNMGNHNFRNGKYDIAYEHLSTSLKFAKIIKSNSLVTSVYESMANFWEKNQNLDSALVYYKQYCRLKDTVRGEETSKKIAESQIKYETEKKEQENKILKQEATIDKKVKQNLYFGITALFLLTVLSFYLFRLKNKTLKQRTLIYNRDKEINDLALKRKEDEKLHVEDQLFAEQQINRLQKEKLEQKYRELSTVTLHIINKNEAMALMLEELEGYKKNPGGNDINTCFNKFSNLIKSNLDLDKNWDDFKKHFVDVYPGFFEKLKEKHPSLTVHDLKLCAYLKMKLSTKEMAQMLNITLAAIEKRRNRLRKKLDINPEIDLLDFVDSIS